MAVERFTTSIEEVTTIVLLSDDNAVGFANPESVAKYNEILDLEDSGVDVVAVFFKLTESDES
jgi:hypothetical protein